jgi:hypothetical protein
MRHKQARTFVTLSGCCVCIDQRREQFAVHSRPCLLVQRYVFLRTRAAR